MKTSKLLLCMAAAAMSLTAPAQSHYHIHCHYDGATFTAPYHADSVEHFDFSLDGSQLRTHLKASPVMLVHTTVSPDTHELQADSITFHDEPLVESNWRETMRYADRLSESAFRREASRWPVGISQEEFRADKVDIVPLDVQGNPGANRTNGVFGGWWW